MYPSIVGDRKPDMTRRTDEECVRDMIGGKAEALQVLYSRYAALVYHIAAQSLDGHGAQDIVQEVFLAVWRKADTFDPGRGRFRPWLLQITHRRILNELRLRSRRPRSADDAGREDVDDFPDAGADPVEETWQQYRRETVRAAVNRLPPAQRQALSLAFFDDLTHDQVAATLNLPVGTVKTRIRSGVQKLRFLLAPLGVAAVAAAILVGFAVRMGTERTVALRNDQALSMVTASDITTQRIPAAPIDPAATHAVYRGRPGTPLAVLALHNFAPAEPGTTYQGWARHDGVWTSMGTAQPDIRDSAVLVAEGGAFAVLPDAVEVTIEPGAGSQAPTGRIIVFWESKNGKEQP